MTDRPPVVGAGPSTAAEGDPGTGPAAVVVNYESGPALSRCVEDLRAEGVTELVVVDNGSRDGSVDLLRDRFPDVTVVVPGSNLGYGSAANRGVAVTTSPLVLVCNPDIELRAGALTGLARALRDDPGCALVGPLIRDAGGARYPSARRFPSMVDAVGHAVLGMFVPENRFTRSYQNDHLGDPAVGTVGVDWVSGACFLVRRTAFEQVGGFDEAYFMYAEDVDLCWRLGRGGWGVAYVPSAEVSHAQGVSTDRHPYRMILEHHRSLLRFAARSEEGWRRLLLPLVALGTGARCALACGLRAVRGRPGASRPAGHRL